MTDNEKRIKLAEAIGWKLGIHEGYEQFGEMWSGPNSLSVTLDFDPFTDANDDYAVLEWTRTQTIVWQVKFAAEIGHSSDYKIGDYARAALSLVTRVYKRGATDGW